LHVAQLSTLDRVAARLHERDMLATPGARAIADYSILGAVGLVSLGRASPSCRAAAWMTRSQMSRRHRFFLRRERCEVQPSNRDGYAIAERVALPLVKSQGYDPTAGIG
jgi:hypothetical protein